MITTTTTAATTKKQFTFGVSENHKNEIGELRKDFTRPAAVKGAPPVVMSEKEALEVLYKVATDRRFKTVDVLDEQGQPVLDSDGINQYETIDLFEKEWEAIKTRDYSGDSEFSTIDKLIAGMKRYGRALNLSEEMINKMIETAKAGQAAPVEA